MTLSETDYGFDLSLDGFLLAGKKEQDDFLRFFVQESNLIEGITPDVRTMYIKDGETEEEAQWRTFPETIGHLKAMKYVLENYENKPAREDEIKKLHSIMGRYLLDEPGSYRRQKVFIRMVGEDDVHYQGKPYFRQVPSLMHGLEEMVLSLENPPITNDQIWEIHNRFEVIHPFIDLNGRVGRLILNWLSLRHRDRFFVVKNNKKRNYYELIKDYEKRLRKDEPDIMFYKDVSIDRNEFQLRQDLKYFLFD